jgi:hypothetical protein
MLRLADILASDIPREQSTSRTYKSLSKLYVSSAVIRPVPRTTVSNYRKKKARKSGILSVSAYENTLQEKLREKGAEDS